jgi:hypothetical protein
VRLLPHGARDENQIRVTLGNRELVVRSHYLKCSDEHFAKASNLSETPMTIDLKPAAKSGAATGGSGSQLAAGREHDMEKILEFLQDAIACGESRDRKMGRAGLEPATSTV